MLWPGENKRVSVSQKAKEDASPDNYTVNTAAAWLNASCNCSLANVTTYWLVLASPDASGGYDYYWGVDYKSNGGEARYYEAKSWTTANLECLTMVFELGIKDWQS